MLHHTPAEILIEGHLQAIEAIRAAILATGQTAPNGRDYPDMGAFDAAVQAHKARMAALDNVRRDLQKQAERIACLQPA